MKRSFLLWLRAGVLVGLCALIPFGCTGSAPRIVLYSAQDREFAEAILKDFHEKTGITVTPEFDTESNKSVSLYEKLRQDAKRPRCDVFWNNEILLSILLKRQGMLESYASPAAAAYPASCRAADDTWHAFAARARILIVNTRLVPENERPSSLLDLTDPRWRDRVVMAKPQFGTSATQAACLFEVLGREKAKEYYLKLKENHVQIAPGNKQVAEWVGQGRTPAGQPVAVGVTDTDDAMEELDAKHDVVIIFPDRVKPAEGRMGTLFIPNTLTILKGSPNPEGAKRLVDYLLSAEIEKRLAESNSHQIPLNPEVKAKLPPEIETPATAHAMEVDLEKAADLLDEVRGFLIKEFAAP
jgi:iron(III) transport system substrate-binding protein